MADLAALGATDAARLARAVRREVIVVQVPLRVLRVQPVKVLRVTRGTQRRNRQHLCLPTLEQPGAMYARDNTHRRAQVADVRRTATVRAHTLLNDLATHNILHNSLHRVDNQAHLDLLVIRLPSVLLLVVGVQFRLNLINRNPALLTVGRALDDLVDTVANLALHLSVEVLIILEGLIVVLRLAQRLAHGLLHTDEVLHGLMRQFQRLDHQPLVNLLSATLHHIDRLFGACNAQVQQRVLHLADGGVHNELIVDVADTHTRHRAMPRNIGDRQRGAGRRNTQNIQEVLLVMAERVQHNLHLVPHHLGEQRANRAIRHTRNENRPLARTPLTPEETSRDAPSGVHLLFIVHTEREKREITRLLAHRRNAEQDRILVLDGDRTTGLLREQPHLNNNIVTTELRGETVTFTCHS